MPLGIKASDKNLLQVYIESLEAADVYAAASVFKELDLRDLSIENSDLWHCNTLIRDGFPSDPDLYGADRKRIWPQYFDQRLFQQGVYERVVERQDELNAELVARSIEQSGLNLDAESTIDDSFVY